MRQGISVMDVDHGSRNLRGAATITSVQEAKRQATISILTNAALRGVLTRGLDVTVDEVADLAGVSRATVFRHFASRDDLLAAAVIAGGQELSADLPVYGGDDWQTWLHELCKISHARAAGTAHGLWDLLRRRDLSPQLKTAVGELGRIRKARYRSVAETLWRACGGKGRVPQMMRDAVAAHLSPLFTITVVTDADGDHSKAARLAELSITAAINNSLGAQGI